MTLADERHALDTRAVARRFDRSASRFDGADFVHAHTRDGLFERLQPVVVNADNVLDLGCATGSAGRDLGRQFRGARLWSVDLSANMLRAAEKKRRRLGKQAFVQADARALPFADGSMDVVFCNLLLPWVGNPDGLFEEVSRVLAKGGLFLFATLGPDSLSTIREAWQSVDTGEHVNHFHDMHDIGDGLVRAGLADPVLDVDRLSVSYDSCEALYGDLTATGARNSLAGRQASLCGRKRFGLMQETLEKSAANGKILVDLELVYGHCWGSGPRPRDGEFRLDANSIQLRRR